MNAWDGKNVILEYPDTQYVLAVYDEELKVEVLYEYTSFLRAEDTFERIGGDLYEVKLIENVDDLVYWYEMSFLF